MFSNRYIYIYATILVVLSAVILTLAAVGLKPMQDKNVRVEKMQQLLGAVSIQSTPDNAEDLFNKYFIEQHAINSKGEIIGSVINGKQTKGTINPFNLDIKKQMALTKVNDLSASLPIYVCQKDGKKSYVVPVIGNGLWGGIWGNIAFAEDLNTIVGVNFDHKSETPGLGAEIALPDFQNQFKGKTIFDNTNFTSVEVIKRADKNNPHQVDAVSGGTITSNGVTDMLKSCLQFYIPYFNSLKK
ncbi:MAG: NADH:ubiquinone reductase (Na(+)-transporting) subunit C [Bacteroidales bacterium]|nr:NADH:ubiquinone reductase (Na(+)-transporting) subunit C [Bacteroidales bacterium]